MRPESDVLWGSAVDSERCVFEDEAHGKPYFSTGVRAARGTQSRALRALRAPGRGGGRCAGLTRRLLGRLMFPILRRVQSEHSHLPRCTCVRCGGHSLHCVEHIEHLTNGIPTGSVFVYRCHYCGSKVVIESFGRTVYAIVGAGGVPVPGVLLRRGHVEVVRSHLGRRGLCPQPGLRVPRRTVRSVPRVWGLWREQGGAAAQPRPEEPHRV
jgi:hypothetical protein